MKEVGPDTPGAVRVVDQVFSLEVGGLVVEAGLALEWRAVFVKSVVDMMMVPLAVADQVAHLQSTLFLVETQAVVVAILVTVYLDVVALREPLSP